MEYWGQSRRDHSLGDKDVFDFGFVGLEGLEGNLGEAVQQAIEMKIQNSSEGLG